MREKCLIPIKRLLVILIFFRGKTVCVIINVSDDTLMLPEYKGKSNFVTSKLFDGKVNPYGVYFLKLIPDIKVHSEAGGYDDQSTE